MRYAIIAAIGIAVIAGLIAWLLPEPTTLSGVIGIAVSAGLAVLVGYLLRRVRDDEDRLAKIERAVANAVDDDD
jgi:hypothetical protein